MKTINYIFFILFIFSLSKIFGEGFVEGTLVKVVDRFLPIEEIQVGDCVDCWDVSEGQVIRNVTGLRSYETSQLIRLFFANDVVVCEESQRFYLADAGWCKAKNLRERAIA